MSILVTPRNIYYYYYYSFIHSFIHSFNLFLLSWLAKIPRIINHTLLLSTKFGRTFRYVKNGVKCAEKLPDYWTVNRKDPAWGQGWLVLVLNTKWRTFHSFHEEEIDELSAKNIARTAKRQLDERHPLFGAKYWYLLTCRKTYNIEDELNIDGGKHVLACWKNERWLILF